MDLRSYTTYARHKLHFEIKLPQSTVTSNAHPDKTKLREKIAILRQQGLSYRQIGMELSIHWTRVGQILKK